MTNIAAASNNAITLFFTYFTCSNTTLFSQTLA